MYRFEELEAKIMKLEEERDIWKRIALRGIVNPARKYPNTIKERGPP
jgi:hypothetical protein